jgi:hypothetical protein
MNQQKPEHRDINTILKERSILTTDSKKKTHNLYQEHTNMINYSSQSLKGILQENDISRVFFSSKNIDIIQNMIKATVYKKSDNQHLIDRQSNTELLIIMRSTYLQYSKNRPNDILCQVKKLNEIVVDEVVPSIIIGIQQHYKYLESQRKLPGVMDLPINMNTSRNRGTLSFNNPGII